MKQTAIGVLLGAILLFALARDGGAAGLAATGLPLAAALLIDLGLCRLLRGRRAATMRPHICVRIAGLGALATSGLWGLAIWSAGSG